MMVGRLLQQPLLTFQFESDRVVSQWHAGNRVERRLWARSQAEKLRAMMSYVRKNTRKYGQGAKFRAGSQHACKGELGACCSDRARVGGERGVSTRRDATIAALKALIVFPAGDGGEADALEAGPS